jgi:hypothetical protein
MSMAALGNTFDIHTGGEDLIFPHHEDEIAQSEGATGQPFVRYWLHVKHLLVNGEKMSKSKGNDFTIGQLVEMGHAPSAIRYLLISAQYRKELNFSFDGLDTARAAIQRLLDFERASPPPPRRRMRRSPACRASPTRRSRVRGRPRRRPQHAQRPGRALQLRARGQRRARRGVRASRPRTVAAARDALARMDLVLGILELARAEARHRRSGARRWVEDRCASARTPAAAATSPPPTASATSSPPPASSSRTPRSGPRWKRA